MSLQDQKAAESLEEALNRYFPITASCDACNAFFRTNQWNLGHGLTLCDECSDDLENAREAIKHGGK